MPAVEEGRPPDFAWGTRTDSYYAEWALKDRLVDLTDTVGIFSNLGLRLPITGTLREEREVEAALPLIRTAPGPVFYVAKVRAEGLPFVLSPKDGALLNDRFRRALLGDDATAS